MYINAAVAGDKSDDDGGVGYCSNLKIIFHGTLRKTILRYQTKNSLWVPVIGSKSSCRRRILRSDRRIFCASNGGIIFSALGSQNLYSKYHQIAV